MSLLVPVEDFLQTPVQVNVILTSPDPVPIVNVNYSSNQITCPAAVDPDCLHSFLCLCLFQTGHKDFCSVAVAILPNLHVSQKVLNISQVTCLQIS